MCVRACVYVRTCVTRSPVVCSCASFARSASQYCCGPTIGCGCHTVPGCWTGPLYNHSHSLALTTLSLALCFIPTCVSVSHAHAHIHTDTHTHTERVLLVQFCLTVKQRQCSTPVYYLVKTLGDLTMNLSHSLTHSQRLPEWRSDACWSN